MEEILSKDSIRSVSKEHIFVVIEGLEDVEIDMTVNKDTWKDLDLLGGDHLAQCLLLVRVL